MAGGIDLGSTAYQPQGYGPRGYFPRYESTGSALSEGIRSGIGLAEHFQDREATQQRQAKDQAFQDQERQNTLDQQDRARTAAEAKAMLDEAADEQKQTGIELSGINQQYGGDISKAPPEVRSQYWAKYNATQAKVQAAHQKIMDGFLTPIQRQAAQTARDLQKGKDASPQDIGDMVVLTAGRPLADFQGGHDDRGMPTKSPVQQDVDLAHQAMESGDPDQIKDAFNTIFSHRLNVGKGQLLPNGTLRGDSKVTAFLPHPDADSDQSKANLMIPVVRTTQIDAGTGQAVGAHDEPYTACKSCNPDAQALGIPMDKATDYVGNLASMQQLIDSPQGQQMMQQSQQDEARHTAILQALANQNTVKQEKKGYGRDVVNYKDEPNGPTKARIATTNLDTGAPGPSQELGPVVASPNVQEQAQAKVTAAGIGADAKISTTDTQETGKNQRNTQNNIVKLTTNDRTASSRETAAGIRVGGAAGSKVSTDEANKDLAKRFSDIGINAKGDKRVDGSTPTAEDNKEIAKAREANIAWRTQENAKRAAKPAAGAGGAGGGKPSEAQLSDYLSRAQAAIANGADPNAVAQRYENVTGRKFPQQQAAQ